MKKLLTTTLLLTAVILSGCLIKPQAPVNNNQNINDPTAIDTSDWKTYKNEEYGFEIQYPKDWKVREMKEGKKVDEEDVNKPVTWVTFGPSEFESGRWNIQFFLDPNGLEQDIARQGNQFSDREEYKNSIKFNGIDALYLLVVTNTYPDWFSESVYFSKNSILFCIRNGAVKDNNFKRFYESFAFIN